MPAYKKMPTVEELLLSIDNILKKEHDNSTRARFLFGLLKVLEESPEKFKGALMERIERLL